MEKSHLTPYCINLPSDQIKKIKSKAGERMVSAFVRDAISSALVDDKFNAGYNKGLRDACEATKACPQIQGLGIHGEYVTDIICDHIMGLEK